MANAKSSIPASTSPSTSKTFPVKDGQANTLHPASKSLIVLSGGRRLRDETDHSAESDYGSRDTSEEASDRDLMLPSPGEYADISSSNPFSESCPDGASEKFDSSSCVTKADKESKNSGNFLSGNMRGRFSRFLGRVSPTKSMAFSKGKTYESIDEMMKKLKVEENEAERVLASDDGASPESSKRPVQ